MPLKVTVMLLNVNLILYDALMLTAGWLMLLKITRRNLDATILLSDDTWIINAALLLLK